MNRDFIAMLFFLIFATNNCIAKSTGTRCINGTHDALNVSLSIEQKNLKLGENVSVQVTVKNMGNSIVLIPALMEPEDYWLRFEIVDAMGRSSIFSGPEVNKMYTEKSVPLLPGYFFWS